MGCNYSRTLVYSDVGSETYDISTTRNWREVQRDEREKLASNPDAKAVILKKEGCDAVFIGWITQITTKTMTKKELERYMRDEVD